MNSRFRNPVLRSAKYNSSEEGGYLPWWLAIGPWFKSWTHLVCWRKICFQTPKASRSEMDRCFRLPTSWRNSGGPPDSFRHKCTWYGWAEQAATQLVWKGPIPSQSFDLNFKSWLNLHLCLTTTRPTWYSAEMSGIWYLVRYQTFLGFGRSIGAGGLSKHCCPGVDSWYVKKIEASSYHHS